MDVVLLVVVIFLALVLIAVNVYLLMYYSHPDDHGFGVALWPKILVVLGLTLAFSQILIIPLDASNSRGHGAGLRLDILWQVVLIGVATFSLILAPFALFFYEADDEKSFCSKICYALKMQFFLLFALAILFAAGYFFLREAQIPIKEMTLSLESNEGLIPSDPALKTIQGGNTISISSNGQEHEIPKIFDSNINMNVSVFIYVIAIFSWIGW